MASTLKIVLAVGGIFIAGAVTGGFAGWRAAEYKARVQRARPVFGPNELGGRLGELLKLTPEQKEKIRPLLSRTSDELRKARRDSFQQAEQIIGQMDAELAKLLTTEQRALLKELRAKEAERRKKWLEERTKRNEPPPPGSPAEGEAPPSSPPADMPPPPSAGTQ